MINRMFAAVTVTMMCLDAFAVTPYTETVNGIKWRYTVTNGEASLGCYDVESHIIYTAVPTDAKGLITIPSSLGGYSVTSIGAYSFDYCSGLTGVTIPDSVTSIASSAFSGCNALIYDTTTIPSVKLVDGWAVGSNSPVGDLDLTGVRGIGSSAFYNCSGLTSVTIPDSVAGIGSSAFLGCSGLTSVTIPNSVTSIGDYAFYGCSGLTSVTIPDSVTSIGDYAFYGCSGLTSVTIPDSVKSIGVRAFSDCSRLTTVTIPDNVTNIGSYAFYSCNGLTSVTIPDSVTDIGQYAFSNCRSLTSVEIGNGVTSIGSYAFYNCSGLTSVYIADLAKWCDITFGSNDSNPLYYAHNLYHNGELLTALIIPDSVTSIGPSAFYNCSSLTSVTIPDSVTSIGKSAFSGCSKLKSVHITDLGKWCGIAFADYASNPLLYAHDLYHNGKLLTALIIPDCVTNIGFSAFSYCNGVTSVTIPDSVTSIGDRAFYSCGGLTSVEIGNCVTSIGSLAFYNCNGLTSVKIPDSVTNIGSSAFSDCSGLTSVTIPDGVTSIGSSAFSDCSGLTNVTIPDGVTNIGSSAFRNCSGLTSVTMPDSVTSIGESAFSGCSRLKSVHITDLAKWCGISFGNSGANPLSYAHNLYVNGELITELLIPNGVTSIGSSAFYNCNGLTSVTIPDSVTNIGYSAFSGCSRIEYMTLPFVGARRGNSGTTESVFGYIFGTSSFTGGQAVKQYCNAGDYDYSTFYIPISLKTVTITDETELGYGAFYNCSGLASATIPDGVTNIGNYAFYNCSGLTSVSIPDSVTNIGACAFYNCSGMSSIIVGSGNAIYTSKNGLLLTKDGKTLIKGVNGNVTIPASVDSIVSAAFSNCSGLTSVMIPDGVTSIGSSAFSDCSGLTSVTIPDSVTNIGSYAFSDCSALANVAIGNGVTSIGYGAFRNCSTLANVTIPQYVCTNSLWSVFPSYSSITNVVISDSATLIGHSAFDGCSKLMSVTIGDSVTSIGYDAFRNCSGLTSVTIGNGVASIGYSAFSGCSGLTSVTIPNCVTNISDSAFYRCSMLMSVTISDGVRRIGRFSFSECNAALYDTMTIPGVMLVDGWAVSYTDSLSGELNLRGVRGIGERAFSGCSGLTCVIMPDSITSIGEYAFSGCSVLTRVTMPDSVTNIGSYAFSGCSGLTSVTIPDSVTSIGYSAFSGCSGLAGVTIGSSVTSIGSAAFSDCSGLTAIMVESGNPNYSSENGLLLTKYGKTLILGVNGNVTIPNSVTNIANRAFDGCSGLTSVTIPDSVTSIGNYAFNGCVGLTSVAIPDSVTSIGDHAFYGCGGLTSVMISDSVTNIGSYAFYNCSGLMSVTIPQLVCSSKLSSVFPSSYQSITNVIIADSVESIGPSAFGGCVGLLSVLIPDSVTSIANGAFADCSGIVSVTVPQVVCSSNLSSVFPSSYQKITDVTVSDSVISIAFGAFEGCVSLAEIKLPFVGSQRGCTGYSSYYSSDFFGYIFGTSSYEGYIPSALRRVVITDDTSISPGAFSGCSQLRSVTISGSVDSIGEGAFTGCGGLTELTLPFVGSRRGNSGSADALFGYIFGTTSFSGGTRTQQFYTPSEYSMFYIPSWLRCVVVTDETAIGYGAFSGCSGLTSVTIPDSVMQIGPSAFADCSNWLFDRTTVSGVMLLDGWAIGTYRSLYGSLNLSGVRGIGDGVFADCKGLKSVTIPSSLICIGDRAFNGCNGLTSILVAEDSQHYSSVNGLLLSKDGHTLLVGINGEVVIPDSVISIGQFAFGNYGGLNSVTIPAAVTNIETGAFAGCSGLETIIVSDDNPCYCFANGKLLSKDGRDLLRGINGDVMIPDSVTSIGAYAFDFCDKLTDLTIPNGVTNIGGQAFSNCRGLTNVVFEGDAPLMANEVFANVNNRCCAYVRRASQGWDVEIPGTWQGVLIDYIHHTVMIDANGGDCSTTYVCIADGGPIGDLPVPRLYGYTFTGWWTEPEGGEKVTSETEVLEDITLFAQWERHVVPVPVVTPADGTVFSYGSCEVAISCAFDGATIYYTDDGSTPKIGDSHRYAAPFTITDTTTIKAVAICDDVMSAYATATITCEVLSLDEALDTSRGVTVDTDSAVPWRAVALQDGVKVGDYCARSGAIGDMANTWMSATVTGAGTLSFWCKVSCEEDEDENSCTWDRLMVYTNGVEITDWRMDGETDWIERTLSFGDGENTVKWVYFKDKSDLEGEDCAWVDGVTWTPRVMDVSVDMGDGKSVVVPGEWLAAHETIVQNIGGDVTTALKSKAANGRLSVVECYVLGLDPEDETVDFRITSFPIKADGTPDLDAITFEPDRSRWNLSGATPKVKGKPTLGAEWQDVPQEGNPAFRFFTVDVQLP